jgi:nardilysin
MITQVLSTPVKSSTDEKKYRVIQLPNGLRALLISDKRVCLKSLDEEERVLDETMSGEDDNDEDEEMEEEESGEDSGSDDEEGEKEVQNQG